MTPDAVLIGARFIHYGALMAMFGVAVFPLYAFRADEAVPGRLERHRRRWLMAATAVGLASALGWLAAVGGAMSGDLSGAVDPEVLRSVLTDTDFGKVWAGRILVILVLLAVAPTRHRVLAALLAAAAVASVALTGHARHEQGLVGAIHVAADAAHLIGAAAWLGGLVPLAVVVGARLRGAEPAFASATTVHRFSEMAYVAVFALVASGLVNSWLLVGPMERLFTTAYGRVLLLKLGAFAAMLALATANRFWISPGLAGPAAERWYGRLGRQIAVEQALGLVVLALVSLLGTMAPGVAGPGA
jgi:putative copper resistance protein D